MLATRRRQQLQQKSWSSGCDRIKRTTVDVLQVCRIHKLRLSILADFGWYSVWATWQSLRRAALRLKERALMGEELGDIDTIVARLQRERLLVYYA